MGDRRAEQLREERKEAKRQYARAWYAANKPLHQEIQRRYRERQRVAIALLTFVVISIALGAFLGLIGWIATGITVVMLFAYLAYLRSAVRNEQRLRAQRAARVARQRRQDEERRRREMAAPQFVPVVEPAPQMRRPGGAVVVEIDDEDPIFDHIPPFQRRRVMREDEDFRRAAAG